MEKNLMIEQRVKEVVAIAEKLYNVDILPNLTITVRNMGLAAGSAELTVEGSLIIEINTEAVEKHLDYVLNDTIPHEVAHLVTYLRPELGSAHNKGWKQVCEALGGSSKRCHSLQLTKRRPTRMFSYTTDRNEDISLTIIRHNKLQNRKVLSYTTKSGSLISRSDFIEEIL
jgi:SprT protein